jgi:hypothetical protein
LQTRGNGERHVIGSFEIERVQCKFRYQISCD